MNTYVLTQRHVKIGETIEIDSPCCAGKARISGALYPDTISGFDPEPLMPSENNFRLVISGYTPAVISVIKRLTTRESYGAWIEVHMLHFNANTGTYTCQVLEMGH